MPALVSSFKNQYINNPSASHHFVMWLWEWLGFQNWQLSKNTFKLIFNPSSAPSG